MAMDNPAADVSATSILWARPAPGTRQPRFTRDDIAAAAIRVADADGFEALTMRRLATELGAGTMTLYYYVPNKDDLLALVMDAIVGEVVVPEGEMPPGWRAGLTTIAHRVRAVIERHPWALDIHDDPAPGPNALRHVDQSMQVVAALDLPVRQRFELVTAIDEYVYGYCLVRRAQAARDPLDPRPEPEVVSYVSDLLDSGGYPTLAEICKDGGVEATMTEIARGDADPDRFDRNLRRLLDGFEAGWRPG